VMKFSSPLRLPSAGRQGLRCAASVGADRFFSFLSIGWNVLFGEQSLHKHLIDPFLNGEQTWHVSDLFPFQNGLAYFPFQNGLAYFPSNFERSSKSGYARSHAKHYNSFESGSPGSAGSLPASELPQQLVNVFRTSWISENEALSKSLSPKLSTQALVSSALSRQEKERREGEIPYRSLVSIVSGDLTEGQNSSIASLCSFLKSGDVDFVQSMSRVLNFMKEEGFGGMRSFGLGQIASVEILALNSSESEKFCRESSGSGKKEYLILSPCIPTQAMLQAVSSSEAGSNKYTLGKAGGWIYDSFGKHTGLKKPVSRFFETGSIFSVKPEGLLDDLSREGYLCYRYGIPFTVAI